MASNAAAGRDLFNIWNESTRGRGMTLVTAGQSGAGKSTLVKNLLRLSDQDAEAPRAAHSADSVTTEVQCYTSLIKNVNVTIIDTPGLAGASGEDETKIIAQLHEKSNGAADMLLYCVSMAPNSKIGELDRRIVNLLITAFGINIWERAIIILTSADYVKQRNIQRAGKPTVQMAMREYVTAFQRLLTGMTVIPVLRKERENTRPANEIAAVAAGEIPDEEILPGMKWNDCVYMEVLKKCSLESVPAILKILKVSSGTWKGAAIGAAGGAAAGAIAGLAFGGVGFIPGAIGGAVGGAGTGYGIAEYRFRNSEEAKLAKIYENIRKMRENN